MSTFLSRVELDDFRTFGHFRLEVAPRPGLTLLVGPNGLGKSSFFDGVEWCLTGRVRRFADHVGRRAESEYLTRRDAKPNSHSVSLEFNTGATFTRSTERTFGEAALLETLKAPSWGSIRDVGAYLALTHFLGQATQQRFTSRTRNDQWQALKGPSGIDRLEQVRTALRGSATTAAFRRRSAQETAEVEVAEQALSRWHDDAKRLAQLRVSARAGGTPGAEDVARDLAALEADCAAAGIVIAGGAGDGDWWARLIAAREVLNAALAATSTQMRQTERLRALAERYDVLAAAADPDGTVARRAYGAVDEAIAAATKASLAGRAVERRVATEAEAVARAELALARSRELAVAAEETAKLKATVAALATRREAVATQSAAAEAARRAADVALAEARALQAARRALEERREPDARIANRAGGLAALELKRQLAEDEAERIQAAAEEAQRSTAGLGEDLTRLRAELATAEAELATARRRASEMAGALAILARHVGVHDEHCPVCTTAFPPGELKALADASARGRDLELAERERAVERILRAIDTADAEITIAAERGMHAATARLQAADAAEALKAARAEVAATLGTAPDEDLAALATGRLAATTAALAEAEAHIAQTGADVAELEAAAADATRVRASLAVDTEILAADMAAADLPPFWWTRV